MTKISELSGTRLEYVVAILEGLKPLILKPNDKEYLDILLAEERISQKDYDRLINDPPYLICTPTPIRRFRPDYTTKWELAGVIIEREHIGLEYSETLGWVARKHKTHVQGKTPLEAAMRCFVMEKSHGEETSIDIPEELV